MIRVLYLCHFIRRYMDINQIVEYENGMINSKNYMGGINCEKIYQIIFT